MEAPKRVLNYLRLLEVVTGERAYVAGGAARDLFHGKEPKDYDIFIPNLVNKPAEVYSAMRGSGLRHPSFEPVYGEGGRGEKYLGVIRDILGDQDGRYCLHQRDDVGVDIRRVPDAPRVMTYPIDIVFRNLEVETVEEVVEGFDANFNLYWFGSDGVIHWLDDAIHLNEEVRIYDCSNRSEGYYRKVLSKLGVYNA